VSLLALKTINDLILFGPTNSAPPVSLTTMRVSTFNTPDTTLRKFWDLGELPVVDDLSPDDKVTEEFYFSTHHSAKFRSFYGYHSFSKTVSCVR